MLASLVASAQSAPGGASTIWDGVFTEAQVARGKASYERSCNRCHRVTNDAIPTRFTDDKFWASWGEDSLAGFFNYVSTGMPNDAPGSLPRDVYADIVAYLLQGNGAPAGERELTPATVPAVRMVRRGSDGTLPEGALVSVNGCLVKTPEGWAVELSSPARRARGNGAADEIAAIAGEPLGRATFRLLYVISSIDRLAGQRVLVRGLLVRKPSEAVNVFSISAVSSQCAS